MEKDEILFHTLELVKDLAILVGIEKPNDCKTIFDKLQEEKLFFVFNRAIELQKLVYPYGEVLTNQELEEQADKFIDETILKEL